MQPRLIVQQKISAFVNKYRIFSATPAGAPDQLVGLAQQKRFKIREKVMFYTDKKRDKLSFTFRAEKSSIYMADISSKIQMAKYSARFAKNSNSRSSIVLGRSSTPTAQSATS